MITSGMGKMTKDEREKEGVGALWDAIDEVLDCKEATLPDWVREELQHAQTKATIAFPHLRHAYMEKKRAGL
jgi:hypothetical protein